MKTLVKHTHKNRAARPVRKEDILRFRVDPRQKKYWLDAMCELGVEDFSSYAREAIDRAIGQDLQSKDPKWQAFMQAIQPQAKEILGVALKDNAKARVEFANGIEKARKSKG